MIKPPLAWQLSSQHRGIPINLRDEVWSWGHRENYPLTVLGIAAAAQEFDEILDHGRGEIGSIVTLCYEDSWPDYARWHVMMIKKWEVALREPVAAVVKEFRASGVAL